MNKIIVTVLLCTSMTPCAAAQTPLQKSANKLLYDSARAGDLEGVKRAITAGAHIDVRDEQEHTALMGAAVSGIPAVVQELIANGADVNAQCIFGYTALIYAAVFNKNAGSAIIQMLIQKGADRNMRDNWGDTAFEWAKRERNQAAVLALTQDFSLS